MSQISYIKKDLILKQILKSFVRMVIRVEELLTQPNVEFRVSSLPSLIRTVTVNFLPRKSSSQSFVRSSITTKNEVKE